MTNILSVQATSSDKPYTNVNQMIRDYHDGKPVLVRGYGPLSGLTVDCYEERTLRNLGYAAIEFCLGSTHKEVAL